MLVLNMRTGQICTKTFLHKLKKLNCKKNTRKKKQKIKLIKRQKEEIESYRSRVRGNSRSNLKNNK